MLIISAPLADAPWYLAASGKLTAETFQTLLDFLAEARASGSYSYVLDFTSVEHVDHEAGNRLAGMVERGEVSLFGANLVDSKGPGRREAIFQESHLEAAETLLAWLRDRRAEGQEEEPATVELLNRLRNSKP